MASERVILFLIVSVVGTKASSADFVDNGLSARFSDGHDRSQPFRRYVWKSAQNRRNVVDELGNWKGRWMPDRPGEPSPPPKIFPKTEPDRFSHPPHGVPMGRPSKNCDDAKTNLTLDWDGSPINHTCYGRRIPPNKDIVPVEYCERIPKEYMAVHKCMDERIEYDDDLPTFGTHRPLWPVYGEYRFLPKQRWLHSLEHGAIVMLYHPCANPLEVKRLRSLLTGCLQRHVISPYNLLGKDRPLALFAWGCRLTMSYANPAIVTRFIREHALRGPEDISTDGDFDDGLISAAGKAISEDVVPCSNYTRL